MRLMDELPPWLQERWTDDKKFARQLRYFRLLYAGTPKWLSPEQRTEYRAIFRKCRKMRKLGYRVQVDHIVPVVSDLVCGLNVPWNLVILHESINAKKGNRWWPDCPHGCPGELFGLMPDPHQLSLGLPLPLEGGMGTYARPDAAERKETQERGHDDHAQT